MAADEAAICNIALGWIGSGEYIDSLTDTSAAGKACKLLYPQSRDNLLERCAWPFATRHATLTDLGLTYKPWKYAYSLPTDYLRAIYIWNGTRDSLTLPKDRVPFAIESTSTQAKILLTDVTTPELVYTAKIVEPGRFPPLFSDAIAWQLAWRLSMRLAAAKDIVTLCHREADLAFQNAVRSQFTEAPGDPFPDSELISGRQ